MSPAAPAAATRTIRLPEETVRALETRLHGTAFASVDDFVAFVVARLLERPDAPPFSEEDERALRERLRSLGYID